MSLTLTEVISIHTSLVQAINTASKYVHKNQQLNNVTKLNEAETFNTNCFQLGNVNSS
jgi:hypothetical protein